MTAELAGKKVRVFDFDDTLIRRELFTRVSGLVIGKIRPHHLPTLALTDIAQLDLNHERVATPISGLKERISFEINARRSVYPGVREEFERLVSDGTDIYGNTGRSNKGQWVDMTEETLQRGRIGKYFKGIFYTPDEVKTAISKAHGIQKLTKQYEDVEFYDDDPWITHFIAGLFPNVTVNLVLYTSTGLLVSRAELDRFPNLRRVALLGKSGT